ncbi:hypothetical protein [Neokomagataea thailandica]|nr:MULTISPECIES: hypothetical protein [Neokomagataea]
MMKSDNSRVLSAQARHKSRVIGLVGGVGLLAIIIYVITLMRF